MLGPVYTNPPETPPAIILRFAAADESFDWERMKDISKRRKKGEQLAVEEQAYHDRGVQLIRDGKGPWGPPPVPSSAEMAKGLVPLSELTDKYKEQDGGLYGGGQNDPPKAHRALAEKAIAEICPLDAAGKPSPEGKIGLISLGMSNTEMEFNVFKSIANNDPLKSSTVIILNCAQGACVATRWANEEEPWKTADMRLKNARISPVQVQAAWIKMAESNKKTLPVFPMHAEALRDYLIQIILKARQRWPNLKVAWLSSRSYGGYGITKLSPEPTPFEGAFSVRWTIQAQIQGNARLNADATKGAIAAPVLLWGPYLWAAGKTPLKANGLFYTENDFALDGTHPSDSGQKKIADVLLKFFTTDPLTKPWFVKK